MSQAPGGPYVRQTPAAVAPRNIAETPTAVARCHSRRTPGIDGGMYVGGSADAAAQLEPVRVDRGVVGRRRGRRRTVRVGPAVASGRSCVECHVTMREGQGAAPPGAATRDGTVRRRDTARMTQARRTQPARCSPPCWSAPLSRSSPPGGARGCDGPARLGSGRCRRRSTLDRPSRGLLPTRLANPRLGHRRRDPGAYARRDLRAVLLPGDRTADAGVEHEARDGRRRAHRARRRHGLPDPGHAAGRRARASSSSAGATRCSAAATSTRWRSAPSPRSPRATVGSRPTSVPVYVDDSCFSDGTLAPGWRSTYVPGEVTYVRSLGRHGVPGQRHGQRRRDVLRRAARRPTGSRRRTGAAATGGAGRRGRAARRAHRRRRRLGHAARQRQPDRRDPLPAGRARLRAARRRGAVARRPRSRCWRRTASARPASGSCDGSGLSRSDRLTATALAQLLVARAERLACRRSTRSSSWLPVGGPDGHAGRRQRALHDQPEQVRGGAACTPRPAR